MAADRDAFYVATNGDDGWSGTLPDPNAHGTDGPFATLRRARDAIREGRAGEGLTGPATVSVRGGRHYLEDTLVLTPADGGTPEAPITYAAYPGEKPVLSGGRRLTGWTPFRGPIVQCAVPGTRGGRWRFRELFVDSRRLTRARFPDFDPGNPLYGGYLTAEGPAEEGSLTHLRYREGTFPRRWAKPTQGEVFLFDAMGWGYTTTAPLRALDEATRTIVLGRGVKDFNLTPWFIPTPIVPGHRFYVENLLEELDQPGEWCLDTEEGVVYLWPPEGTDPNRAEVVAPSLERLIDLRAAHVVLSGLVFTETRRAGEGAHPTGLGAMDGVGAMFSPVDWGYCGEALHLQGASQCVIEDCEFRNLGGNGVYLQQLNERNRLRGNHFTECGSNGIVLAGLRVLVHQTKPEHPFANRVTDNEIDRIGVWDKSAAGVFCGRSEGTEVAHNLIHHVPHHAINLGNDGYGRNYVEYNRIHHTCLETHDTGAINVWMEDAEAAERAGHLIRHNFISDVGNPNLPDNPLYSGMYLDNECSNCVVYGNIIARTRCGVFAKGRNNVIENNVFADIRVLDSPGAACLRNEGSVFFGDLYNMNHRVMRNLFHRAHRMALTPGHRAIDRWDENVYFNGEEPLRFVMGSELSLEDWRKATGFDEHSIVADPLFVDPEHDDYRLRPDSPALKLGFVPIDMSRIGPRPRGAW